MQKQMLCFTLRSAAAYTHTYMHTCTRIYMRMRTLFNCCSLVGFTCAQSHNANSSRCLCKLQYWHFRWPKKVSKTHRPDLNAQQLTTNANNNLFAVRTTASQLPNFILKSLVRILITFALFPRISAHG